MRPRVIVHNSTSIDGSLSGFELDLAAHFGALGQLEADAILMGSEAALRTIDREPPQPAETDEDNAARVLDPADPRPLWFFPDSEGKLQGALHFYRRFELCKDIVVLVSKATPAAYRSWLTERNYKFLEAGSKQVDLAGALRQVGKQFGCKRMVTDGGPGLVGALFTQDLVDELSLVVFPSVVAGAPVRLFEGLTTTSRLELEDAWALESGAIHLRWTVKRA